MKSVGFALGSFLLMTLFASASMAQAQRTFVSGLGNDGNPCTRTAPCRTFAQAIFQTVPGGELIALDAAGYGPCSISQSITIHSAVGVYAGITVPSGGAGVTVSLAAGDVVVLRGLAISTPRLGPGMFGPVGISAAGAGTLHVENCVIGGSLSNAIAISCSAEIKDSIIRRDDVFDGTVGICGGGPNRITADNVRLEGWNAGITVEGNGVQQGPKAAVRNSVISRNNTGIFVAGTAGPGSELNIENCLVAHSGSDGIFVETNTEPLVVRISNSTIVDNGAGIVVQGTGAQVLSRGNNTVEGNNNHDIVLANGGSFGSYAAK